MQIVIPEQAPVVEEAAESAPPAEIFDLNIDVEPYLPDLIVPLWNILQDYPVFLVIIMFALGYGAGKAIQWALRAVLSKAASKTKTTIDDQLILYLTAPVVQTTVVLALMATVKAFGFGDSADWFLIRSLLTLLLVFWGRAWFKATSIAIQAMSRRSTGSRSSRRAPARCSKWVSSCFCSAS